MNRKQGVIVFLAIWLAPQSWCFLTSHIPSNSRFGKREFSSLALSTSLGKNRTNDLKLRGRSLGNRTKELLKRSSAGSWSCIEFYDVQDIFGAWSRKPTRKNCIILERLMRRIIEEKIAGNPEALKLNMHSMYNNLLVCWAKSGVKGAAQRTEEILDNMQSAYEDGDLSLKPDISAFNAVLNAYAESKQKDSPRQTARVLQKLHDLREQNKTDVKPNRDSYVAILRAYAAVGGQESPLLVHRILTRMDELSKEGYLTVKPDCKCHNVYLGALLGVVTHDGVSGVNIAKKAEKHLMDMLQNADEDAKPSAWSFNIVISIWSKSGNWEMANKAEELLRKLEEYHEASDFSAKTEPNTNTYNCVIACYSRSTMRDKADRAHKLLEEMKDMKEKGMHFRRPDAVTYNTVMNTYAKSKIPDAPLKVESLLREMQLRYEESGDRFLRPSSRSFNTCVDAWAKSNQPQAADRIIDWIRHLEVNYDKGKSQVAPNKWTYNAYLEALSKTKRPSIGEEAERVLQQMDEQHKHGRIHLKPDVLTYTNVIHCIALSGAEDAFERAYSILSKMENLHASGYNDVRPNAYTYNCVINAVAKSKLLGKAKIAIRILRRMELVALKPISITYNNILNACAFSDPYQDDKHEVLDIALSMLDEAQKTCGANFITYGTCLRVVSTFEEDVGERWRLTRDIFRRCCDDGQLSKLVLNQVKFTSTPAQFALLLNEVTDEKTGKFREDYTRKARRVRKKPAMKKTY